MYRLVLEESPLLWAPSRKPINTSAETVRSRWTWAHVLLQEHQNHNQLLNSYQQQDAGTYQKRYPTSKEKEETTVDGRRGTIMIKSNPIPTSRMTLKLENNNTKEVLSLLWRFWTPHQASQPGDLTKGLGIPRESDLEGQGIWLQDFHRGLRKTPDLEGACKTLPAPRPGGKEQWAHRRLIQNYQPVLQGLLWSWGLARAHHRDGGTVWKGPPWHKLSWRSPSTRS